MNKYRIDDKTVTLTNEVVESGEPAYISLGISICFPRRELRSPADTRRLNAERTNAFSAGSAFRSSSPVVWNILLFDVRTAPSIATFKEKLKAFHCGRALCLHFLPAFNSPQLL